MERRSRFFLLLLWFSSCRFFFVNRERGRERERMRERRACERKREEKRRGEEKKREKRVQRRRARSSEVQKKTGKKIDQPKFISLSFVAGRRRCRRKPLLFLRQRNLKKQKNGWRFVVCEHAVQQMPELLRYGWLSPLLVLPLARQGGGRMKRREGARLLGRERDEEFDSEGFLLPLASAAKAFSFAAPSQARFSLSCSPSFPLVLFTGDGMRRARPARVVGVDVGALRESARRYPRICLCSSPRRGRRRRPGRKKKKEKKQRYHSSCPSRLTAFSPSLWSSPSPHLTGSDATLGMCSACFREHQKSNASSGPQAPPVVPQGAETAAAVAAVAAATSSQPEPEASATAAGAPVEAATAAAPEAEMAEAATTAKAENEA